MRIMITGGGTGGHVFPAVAIIEELRRRDPQLLLQWVGRRNSMEQEVSTAQSVPFRALPVEGWPRRNGPRRAWVGVKLAVSIAWSAQYLWRFRPQVVLGVGGYVSLPLMWTAQRLGIATMLHEQNKNLGMANRLLAPCATRIFLSYPDTVGRYPHERARLTGNPVRAGFAAPPARAAACYALGLEPQIPVVLVSGGSQGAQTLNRAMGELAGKLNPGEAQIIWMTGKSGLEAARRAVCSAAARIEAVPFIEDMVTACAAADIIVSRAGASSSAEIAMLGKPSILVPYPHATDNHQEQNARAFVEAGASRLMLDGECTGDVLLAQLRELLADRETLESMARAAGRLAKPLAAETIVEEVILQVFGKPAGG